MKRYYYKARNRSGTAIHGCVEAESESGANDFILEKNLIPIQVNHSIFHSLSGEFNMAKSAYFKKVPKEDLLVFTQQLQIMHSIQVSLVEGLTTIWQQTKNEILKGVLSDVISSVKEGKSLSAALKAHPLVFDSVYTNLVAVGEATGDLDEILMRLHELIQSKVEHQLQIKSALFYPKIVIAFLLVVFVTVVNFVIPKLRSFLVKLGGDLPEVTKWLLAISDFFASHALLIFLTSFIGLFSLKYYLSTHHGRHFFDKLILKLPIVGDIVTQVEMSSLCIALEILFRSGIDLVKGFGVIKGTLSNTQVIGDVETCLSEVKAGGTIAQGLNKGQIITPMVVNLVSIGENSGAMEKVLNHLIRYYQFQVKYKLQNFSKSIEPILLFVIFGSILLLAVGVFLPLWGMSTAIKGASGF